MDSPSSPILDLNKSSKPGKVCTVYSFMTDESGHYAVLIVDLASSVDGGGGYISTAPTLLIDHSKVGNESYTFCVLDSVLYMFQVGYDDGATGCREGNSGYSINLYPHLIDESKSKSAVIVDESMLRPLPKMLFPKNRTEVVPTPDGEKILVFSLSMDYIRFSQDSDPIDFELFCPAECKRKRMRKEKRKRKGKRKMNPWKRLPSPKDLFKSKVGVNLYIDSFAFITDSVFLIETNYGIFTIDIDAVDDGWKKRDSFAGSKNFPFGGPFFVDDDLKLCISGNAAYKICDGLELIEEITISCIDDEDDLNLGCDMCRACGVIYGGERGDELFGSAFLQTGISKETEYVHIRLDICKFNLDKFTEDVKVVGKDEISPIIKKFKFVIEGYKCFSFYPLCLLPIFTYSKRHRMKLQRMAAA